jgi:hypothetical protein
MKVEDTVIAPRQFKTTSLAFSTQLPDVPDFSLLPSFYTELVEAFFAHAHDAVLVAGLRVKSGNRFFLMAG